MKKFLIRTERVCSGPTENGAINLPAAAAARAAADARRCAAKPALEAAVKVVRGNQAFVGSTGGRPPAEYSENCDFRDKKAGEFAANTVPLDDLDDWAAAEARARFSPQAAAAAGGGAGGGAGAVEGMEEGAAAEEERLRKVKLWSNFARRRVIQYLCHSWLMNGEHAGWSGVSDLRNKVKLHFDLATLPAHQTASD